MPVQYQQPQYQQSQHQPQQYQQQQYQQSYGQEYEPSSPGYQEIEYEDGYDSEPDSSRLVPSKPLVLHQGSTVQFPSKDPNPNAPRLPDAPHLGEEKHAMIRPTVCQFPKEIRDPNAKLIDGSHLGEEGNRLRQGGVCQFPREYKAPRDVVRGYQPPDSINDTLPVADVEHPDHLLPSQARRQQTYITHPSQQSLKPIYGLNNTPRNRNVPEWPPKRSGVRELPRVGFNSGHIHPEGAKHFIWPPPRPRYEKENQDLPPPGSGPAANAWNPQGNGETIPSYRPVNIQRRRPIWPPPERGPMRKQNSLPETARARKQLEFEEYMRHHAGTHIPPTYHAPPGTQYYEVQYELMD